MLYRAILLYQLLAEVKKVLTLILKQEELFDPESGLIYPLIKSYKDQSDKIFRYRDFCVLGKGLKVLKKVSFQIHRFLSQSKFIADFIFKGKSHQEELLQHAFNMCMFLKEMKDGRRAGIFYALKVPNITLYGYLTFLEVRADLPYKSPQK